MDCNTETHVRYCGKKKTTAGGCGFFLGWEALSDAFALESEAIPDKDVETTK